MPNLMQKQRRTAEVGIIRIGDAKVSDKVPGRPRQTFRFTSVHRRLLEKAQEVYGGELRPWKSFPGHWELLSERDEIKALFSVKPKGDAGDCESMCSWYELWKNRSTVLRRCDGFTCETWDNGERVQVPCMCDHEAVDFEEQVASGKACALQVRVNLILPELPSLGTWRLNTGSTNFAKETEALIEQIRMLGLDYVVPVTLKLTFREGRTAPDKPPNKYPVAVLSLDSDPVSLPAMVAGLREAALGIPAGTGLSALPAPEQTAEPVEAEIVDETPEERASRLASEAEAFLVGLGMTELELHDFRAWCESEGLKWNTAAQRAKRIGVTDKAMIYRTLLEAKNAGS